MSGFEINLFHQSLSGLIKALRANKRDEQKVIDTALAEIREEVRSKDWDVKAAAVLKLTYLEMLGHPTLIQHSFPVIECMASSKFHIKQIGYLAASQSFGESTETILLTNNLIKKDLTTSSNVSTVILALTSLPTLLISSPQLANDLLPDLLRMLAHSKPQVRRITTLTIGKIWTSDAYTIALEFSHVEKLRSGLNDEDPSVVSAAVNVMLELGRSRPESLQSLLGLAPELFDLLTNSTNNWMLIKIVKLFALLTPIEPRLVRKLLPPLSNLINTTPAFSLLYECIQTVITGGMLSTSLSSDATTLARTCIDKLSSFLTDSDQNLRYIALKGLSRLLYASDSSNEFAGLLTPHYDDILACIDEEDLTIRLKALELVEKLTDRSNCKIIVNRLLNQISPQSSGRKDGTIKQTGSGRPSAAAALRAISSSYDTTSPSGLAQSAGSTAPTTIGSTALASYRYRLLLLILRMTSKASDDGTQLYVNITNFEWYVDILITVSYLALSLSSSVFTSDIYNDKGSVGSEIADALLDVTSRAMGIREFTVRRVKRLLDDDGFVERGTFPVTTASASPPIIDTQAIVETAAFIVSEYDDASHGLDNCNLLLSRLGQSLSGEIALNAVKGIAKWLQCQIADWSEGRMPFIKQALETAIGKLGEAGLECRYFARLLQQVHDGLNGPRLDVQRETATSPAGGDQDPPTEPETPGEDPSHNPFAESGRGKQEGNQRRQQNEDLEAGSGSQDKGAPMSLSLLSTILFPYELKPLAPNAQELVDVPDNLDLDAWIGEPIDTRALVLDDDGQGKKGRPDDVDEYGRPRVMQASTSSYASDEGGVRSGKKLKKKRPAVTRGYNEYDEDEREEDLEKDEEEDVDSIPIVKLDLGESGGLLSPPLSKSGSSGGGSKKGKKKATLSEQPSRARTPSPPPIILTAGGELPTRLAKTKASSATPATGAPQRSGSATSTPPLGQASPAVGNGTEEHLGDTSQVIVEQAPIKVVKIKKKKKKATVEDDVAGGGGEGEGGVLKAKKTKKKQKEAVEGE